MNGTIEYILVITLVVGGMLGSLDHYEGRLANQAIVNQEML